MCGGEVRVSKIPYFYQNRTYLGDFDAEICEKCNSTFFTEESFYEIQRIAKLRNLWGERPIQSPFSSLTVRIRGRSGIVKPRTLFGHNDIIRKTEYTIVVK